MDYIDTLQKVTIDTVNGPVKCVGCSYGGVSFFVKEDEYTGGRNISTTAIPYSNKHVNQDHGGVAKRYNFTLYIVGEDAEAKRSELQEAFEKEGPAELVHMYCGRFKARCVSFGFSHISEELSYINGTASFVSEDDPKKISRAVEDARGVAEQKASESLSKVKAAFQKAFDIAGKASSVVNAIQDEINSVLDKIENVRNGMREVAKFVLAISQIRDDMMTLLKAPGEFVDRIQDLLTMTKETFATNDGSSYVNEALTMMDVTDIDDGATTTSFMVSLIQKIVLISSAAMVVKSVIDSEFENAEQVREMQEQINVTFETAMAKVLDVDDYMSLSDMLAVSVDFLNKEKSDLAIIVERPLNDIDNILTSCFDCYGSLDRVEDIIDRNEIFDPSAINRKNLKVLSK